MTKKKKIVFNLGDFQDYPKESKYLVGKVWIFNSPQERQQWLDEHYVEVEE